MRNLAESDGEKEGLPDEVTTLLSSVLGKDEEVIYSAPSDIDEDGRFSRRWLILTKEKIVTLNPDTKHVSQTQLAAVRSAFVKDYVGNAKLIVETNEGLNGIIRFSCGCLEDFYNAARLIDKIAKKEIVLEDVDADVLNNLSGKNGIKKSQTFKWLMVHLKPHLHYTALALFISLFITGLSLTPP